MFNRIGLIAKPDDERVQQAVSQLIRFLKSRDLDVAVDKHCAARLSKEELDGVKSLKSDNARDLLISIGGDGTLLRAAHKLPNFDVRLLGINLGTLGFLTDISPGEMEVRLARILAGEFLEEPRSILRCSVVRGGKLMTTDYALNDTVIQKWDTARLIRFDTYVNDTFVNSQRSDGVIISTPTGSTAYALSCGGPILQPGVNAIALVPVSPHTLSNRPIVIDSGSKIRIEVEIADSDQVKMTCDGDIKYALEENDHVIIEKSDRSIRLIHPTDHDYYATLRAKLKWG